MINIHLYPSAFLNESRILREARSLARLTLFERIDLVGIGEKDLAAVEEVQEGMRIVRVGQRTDSGLIGKIKRTATWSHMVYDLYRNEKIGCINCHSVATLPLGVMLRRRTGARLVYDAHELESETNGLSGVRKFITKCVERVMIGQADHCIFVGRAIEQWYIREYELRNTTVLYNCPPRRKIAPTTYFHEKFSIEPNVPIFLYQGFIGEGRGIQNLLKAFSALGGRAALIVMGYGPLTARIVEESTRHANVHYHPPVSPDRLLDYTAGADFGLSVIEPTSLSYEYCMPNKLFEYVMANKPVLVSPTTEQSEFVRSHAIGEVARDTSPAALREGVLSLLGRDIRSLSTALEQVADEYCWEGQEKKLEAVYLESLNMREFRRRKDAQLGV